jgi:hypothetical protein
MSLGTWNIHELHLIQLEHSKSVNPSLWWHLKLVLKPKQTGKPSDSDLILLPYCHPHKLLSIYIKVQCGIELADDLFVLVIHKTHHLSHLQLIKSSFYLVEDGVPFVCHPILVDPLSFHHGLCFVEVD